MQLLYRLICVLLVLALAPFSLAQDEQGSAEGSGYFAIKPGFVVNYGGAGRLRYFKTEITLRVKTGGGASGMMDVRHHLPYIRHALVMLFTRQTDEDMSSMDGRELLRQAALKEVRRVLEEEEGEEFILDLLFDSFVIQR